MSIYLSLVWVSEQQNDATPAPTDQLNWKKYKKL